jgi:hypothetical protein
MATDGHWVSAFGTTATCGTKAKRFAMLTAKLKLLDEPPHTL